MTIKPDFDPVALEGFLGGPVALSPVASGQSNPTWFVTQGTRRLVLRKKPMGATLDSAHAVEREYRIMKALADSGVPVPKMVMLEEDPSVLGTPFYLMERLEGAVSDKSAMEGLDNEQRREIYRASGKVLASLHRVDWESIGLSDYGKHSGYYERQVRRWARQWQASKTREDLRMDELETWFATHLPAEQPTTIVHGDFRIGNLMYALDPARIVGVLDWELSTLGDPLADLAHAMMFWRLQPDQLGGLAGLDLGRLHIPDEREYMDIYREARGEDCVLLPFHRAFAFYRMAVIFEGITARAKAGQAAHEDALKIGALAPACRDIAIELLSGDAL